MAETSEITWTDATFNPWIGCTKVGPACDGCYAERDNKRRKWVAGWGPGVPRKRTSDDNWKQPRRWNNAAGDFFAQHQRMRRVFSASLADIFDNEVDEAWRADFWTLVRETPNLQWLIVTKRIGNARKMLPADWGKGYPNVVLIVTVVTQEEVDRDVPKLINTPARFRGLSIEPMLAPVDLFRYVDPLVVIPALLDWVIVGGESGPEARPTPAQWVRPVRDQCERGGVAFHFKQWGEWSPYAGYEGVDRKRLHVTELGTSVLVGKKIAGRLVDGVTHNGFPPQ